MGGGRRGKSPKSSLRPIWDLLLLLLLLLLFSHICDGFEGNFGEFRTPYHSKNLLKFWLHLKIINIQFTLIHRLKIRSVKSKFNISFESIKKI